LYIENTAMFAEVAQGLGIKSILHRDYESTIAQLKSFGVQSG
jgi:putative hydrolase of the HAD superfamily